MSSIKKLKTKLAEDLEILSLTRKEVSLPLSKVKLNELTFVVHRFVQAQNYILRNFSGIEGLIWIKYPRELRDQYVREGLPLELAILGLQDRQWKMALDVAFDTIKSSHAKTHEAVKTSLSRSNLSDPEKHLVRFILLRPNLLSLVCQGKQKEAEIFLKSESQASHFRSNFQDALNGKTSEIKLKKVTVWLRRRYRELHSKHRRPLIRKQRTYHVDSSMFKFFKEKNRCYITAASMTPRERIVIPLTNASLTALDFSGNIKVVLRKDQRVEIHRALNQFIKKPQTTELVVKKTPESFKIVSIDKGLRALIHTDSQKKYGDGYSKKFQEWSDQLTRLNAGRQRFYAFVKNLTQDLQKAKNPRAKARIQKKINRIQENNLGDKKISGFREFLKLEVRKEIGTAVNSLFNRERPQVLVTENLKFISFKSFGKRVNRLLNTWSKGTLRDALEKGAKKNGVLLVGVNAAYTSQLCPNCFYVNRKNRNGDKFDCGFCHHKGDADFVAASNVRERFFDSEISEFSPVKRVKEILLRRHRMILYHPGLERGQLAASQARNAENL